MQNIKKHSVLILIILITLLGALGGVQFRWDLTSEKRYTLSDATIKTLKNIKKPLKIEVYLEGDFPASFKQLQSETKFLLEEFRRINPNIDYEFIDPLAKKMSQETLMAMGMQPSILPEAKDGEVREIVIFPYAVAKYNSNGLTLPLIIQQVGISAEDQLSRSIENLEYSFVSTIKNISQEKKKNIGILVNQDELRPDEFSGFMDMALENYNAGPIIPNNQTELSIEDFSNLKKVDALVIAKPRKAFTDREKVILDQYIMNGGKTLWMMDAVNAEMDTLFQSKKIMAFPIDLNMTDFFFHYGIRINSALVKDLQKSALLRLQTGQISGNPQYSSFLWPYYPIGINENPNAITKNINPIKLEFPTSIDTLARNGIKKEILLESSGRTLLKTTPNYVSLNEIVRTDSLGQMERPTTPKIFAVALSGKFTSAYATRSERKDFPNFKAQASNDNKMIVISDGDVGKNQVLKGETMPLGYDIMTDQYYGNEQFLRNALDYLLDDNNLISLRNRNIETRLLDRRRISEEKSQWQWLNMLLPITFAGALGGVFYYLRRKKYQ